MENTQGIDRQKILAEVTEKLNELDELQEVEGMIQNNTIEFQYNGTIYRVRKPNRREREELRLVKNKKQTQLLKDPNNVTEEELIKILLDRSIPVDIPKMRQDIRAFQQKIESLAVDITETASKPDRDKLIEQAESLRYEQLNLQYRINELLSSCVEKQLKDFIQEYLVYVVLEKKADADWVKYFKSYDEFMDSANEDDDNLIYRAAHYMAALLHRDA